VAVKAETLPLIFLGRGLLIVFRYLVSSSAQSGIEFVSLSPLFLFLLPSIPILVDKT